MHLPLAVKCQLLFGAAIALIITAALFVPWQRMEELTEQINQRAAQALCDSAIADHIAGVVERAPAAAGPATGPAATRPAPATAPTVRGRLVIAPRLVLLWPPAAQTPVGKLTGFERSSIPFFAAHPEAEFRGRLYQNQKEDFPYFQYARPLHAEDGCLKCHSFQTTTVAAAATHPATAPAGPQMIGLVSIDMRSQLGTNQLLLNHIFLLTAGLLTATLAVIVFTLITNRLILQPVHVLQETAEKVSQGDLNIRSHISTGDEFEQLSRTFNVMLANLKASEDQLRAVNKSLDLKLGQLAESNVALYESNRLKSEFLANVSHELRTPLNSILGFAELLKETAGGPTAPVDARMTRYIQNILTSGRNLLELINDLLDLAKIEAGRMEVRSEPLPLNDLFEGLGSILKPLLEKQEVALQTAVAADVPLLQTDGPKLQQVLYNFLSNAIKFSPPKASIELRAELWGQAADGARDQVRISVTDRGPGIDLEKQELIFEKFRQIDGSVTRQHSGTGLGLAISKELIGLLGGAIGVTSIPGQGATFWVILPLKISAGPQDVKKNLVLS
jgi:signal transduction histidine kinase